jgi:1-acyl-sn-glycerol-3-phosphate acyltransferase
MIQPTPEQYAVLTRMERLSYRMGDLFSRRLPWLSLGVNLMLGMWVVRAFVGRRLVAHGIEHLGGVERTDRLLLVANHRSFFDLFVVVWMLWHRTRVPRRLVMPVRATYFYSRPTGPLLNLAMSGFSMFPPILRDRERGQIFNPFSQARMVEETARPGTVMGMHPEGTRNKGDDPYSFLPPKAGTGRIIRRAPGITVVPVFVHGLTNDAGKELWRNWTQPSRHIIDIVYGEPIDFADLLALPDERDTHERIVERCMKRIAELAGQQRKLRARLPG